MKRCFMVGCTALAMAGASHADPEIMVHEGDLAERGELVATLHGNYTPKGDRQRDDGTWPTHRLSSLMAEFATGLAPGWEAGIHLPFMRAGIDSDTSQRGDWGASAVMFRLKHIRRRRAGCSTASMPSTTSMPSAMSPIRAASSFAALSASTPSISG
jgi:hypothetical protein